MTKREKARNILIKSKWIDDHYYVIKVMNSCVETKDVPTANAQLSKAFQWGLSRLKAKMENLRENVSLTIGFPMVDIVRCYINDLFDIKYKLQDKINYETV